MGGVEAHFLFPTQKTGAKTQNGDYKCLKIMSVDGGDAVKTERDSSWPTQITGIISGL
jgi:hypothetical protein